MGRHWGIRRRRRVARCHRELTYVEVVTGRSVEALKRVSDDLSQKAAELGLELRALHGREQSRQ
jgi:transcriptional regulator NrdR family protein